MLQERSGRTPAMSTTKGSGHSKAFCKGQNHTEAFSKRHLGMCHHGFIPAKGHALLATWGITGAPTLSMKQCQRLQVHASNSFKNQLSFRVEIQNQNEIHFKPMTWDRIVMDHYPFTSIYIYLHRTRSTPLPPSPVEPRGHSGPAACWVAVEATNALVAGCSYLQIGFQTTVWVSW